MTNKFFDAALHQASRFAGKKSRIMVLLLRLSTKMQTVNWSPIQRQLVREKLSVIGRLAKAYATGRYKGVPWKAMLILIAAVIYFINPLDLIPDIVPVLGLSDDFAVLIWVYNAIEVEIDKFLEWETEQSTPI